MKDKRGEQTDRCSWNSLRYLRKGVVFRIRSVNQAIQTPAGPLDHTATHQAEKVLPRDACRFNVTRAKDSLFFGECGNARLRRLLQYVIVS